MTECDRDIDVAELRERCPSDWNLEVLGGRMVVGFAPSMASCPDGSPATFYVYPEGDLWTAVWWPPITATGPAQEWPDRITGLRVRCIEWLIEKADSD